MSRWFQRVVLRPRWAAFIVMGVSFLAFGAGTANLVLVLQANVELLTLYGALAVMEGALWQLAQIIATAYASMLAWVIFKACEYRLVQGLTDPED